MRAGVWAAIAIGLGMIVSPAAWAGPTSETIVEPSFATPLPDESPETDDQPAPAPSAAPAPPPVFGPDDHPRVFTNPDWLRRPTGDDVARFYPVAAYALDIEGVATISCIVSTSGALKTCDVVSERPIGLGFGQAAVRMSALFEMRPMTMDGAPVSGGKVRIPIRFSLPPSDPVPPWPEVEGDPKTVAMARRIIADEDPVAGKMMEPSLRLSIYRQLEVEIPEDGGEKAARPVDLAVKAFTAAFISGTEEILVRTIARTTSFADLSAAANFLEGSTGKAWLAVRLHNATLENGWRDAAIARGVKAGQAALCADSGCPPGFATLEPLQPSDQDPQKMAVAQSLIAASYNGFNLALVTALVGKRLDQVLPTDGRPDATQRRSEALVKGVESARAYRDEMAARSYAQQMSIQQMKQIVAYLTSPASNAEREAGHVDDLGLQAVVLTRAAKAGHDAFCQATDCSVGIPRSPTKP